MKSTDNTVTNNQSAKEMANMKKSNRTFEAILAEAKKQQNQLDNARMAWSKAKTPAAKELAQKTGEKAKNRLEQLRRQWRNAKAASPVQEVKPAVKEAVVMSKEDELKKKYHEMKVRGEQELFSVYKEELSVFEASLKEKYAEKKKELHTGLLKLYKEELGVETSPAMEESIPASALESIEEATLVVPADKEMVKVSPEIAMAIKGKKDILVEGSVFESASGNCYYVNTQFNRADYTAADSKGKQKLINAAINTGGIEKVEKQDENLLFSCDNIAINEQPEVSSETALVSVEAPVENNEKTGAVKDEVPVIEKVNVYVDPELDSIAFAAMESSSDTRLNCGETFLDENGNTYVVETFFEYVVFTVSDRAAQEKMIREALTSGDIRMVKKAAA